MTSMLDKFHDECGVVAIHGHPEAANLAYLGLHRWLQDFALAAFPVYQASASRWP